MAASHDAYHLTFFALSLCVGNRTDSQFGTVQDIVGKITQEPPCHPRFVPKIAAHLQKLSNTPGIFISGRDA
jgi:hypothetical protein